MKHYIKAQLFGLYNHLTIMRILSILLTISTVFAARRSADYTTVLKLCVTGKAFKNPTPYKIGRAAGSSGSKSVLLNQKIVRCQALIAKLRQVAICNRAGFKNC